MAEQGATFSGSERAAVLLMALGETDASEVLRHMGPREVQKVGTAMATLANVTKTQVDDVLNTFANGVGDQTALGVGSDEYIRRVLVDALGDEKAGGLIDRILLGRNSKGLESLKWMDPRAVAEIIRLEHPQIIAIVMSYLDSDHAAEALSFLPERVSTDVLMRIATLDSIQPAALAELDEILEKQFAGNTNLKSSSMGGPKSAANILNFLESGEARVLESIKESDNELAEELEELMFVFDNLIDVDDRGIQTLMREVSSDVLVLALKGAEETLKEKIFKNMSKRAAEMMRDDLEAKGPVRLSEVEGAQKEILGIARRLSEAGEIALGGAGGEEYV